MNCPNCDYHFTRMSVSGGTEIPPVTPVLCEKCCEVCLLVQGTLRKATDEELAMIKMSPAWHEVLGPVQTALIGRRRAAKAMWN